MKKYLAIFFALLALDIFSKYLISHTVPLLEVCSSSYPFGGIPLFNGFLGFSFSFNYVVNTGTAFGLFSGHPQILLMIRCLIVGLFGAYLMFSKNKQALPLFPTGLILTGAIGNIIDLICFSHVIDFFHFTWRGVSLPIFNLADTYISLGVCILFFTRSSCRGCSFES